MDKFRLFYEEILKISLSENPLSQMVKFKTTQDNLRFTNSVMHQLISTQFLGQSFNIESLIVVFLYEVAQIVEHGLNVQCAEKNLRMF